jgi:multidrug efflux pump subunit AcrA (membrane-fusion protein)
VRVRIGFDQLEAHILPDMGIKVRFLDDQPVAQNASKGPRIRVPSVAVQRDGGDAYVWVVSEGRVERRAVTVGAENDGNVEVLAGVSSGEELVSPVVAGLEDGGKVKLADSNS